ncbi:MAG TPA: redoxin family protein [Blastocatellia bacterium]|nr:redoxin family protein [Blastocatellia bacterium]
MRVACFLLFASLCLNPVPAKVEGPNHAANDSAVESEVMADDHPSPLDIGSPAPPFRLRGVDGKTYSLLSFRNSKVLVVIFTAVHCPTAEVYENRIKKLVSDYRSRGVAFVVIQPNSPKALRLDEMGYTDLGDSLAEMKVRAAHRRFNFPFLYDGDAQQVSRRYGPTATPHVFVFDRARKLRYQGRVDSNPREAYAKVPDARNAIDAVLAGSTVPVEKTPAVGCSIKWLDKQALHDSELKKIESEKVPLEKAGLEDMKALRKNGTGKTLLVNFWATWCGPCTKEFPELQKTWRMYRKRPFQLVTVSINYPDEEKGVRRFLEEQHASTRNLLFGSMDPYELMKGFDGDWDGSIPYTMVIAPDGQVLYKMRGLVDIQKVRRLILASFPDDDYIGQNAYWNQK